MTKRSKRNNRFPPSSYHMRRIHPIGYFKVLPLELVVYIFKYIIQNCALQEIIWLANTCNWFRNLIREWISVDVQARIGNISFKGYTIMSNIIYFEPTHLNLAGDRNLTNDQLCLLSQFDSLDLRNTSVNNFAPLTNVRRLSIDVFSETLYKLTNLEHIRIYNTKVPFGGLYNMLAIHDQLKSVKLKHVHGIHDHEITMLSDAFPQTTIVYIPHHWASNWGPHMWNEIHDPPMETPRVWGPGIWLALSGRSLTQQLSEPSLEAVQTRTIKNVYPKASYQLKQRFDRQITHIRRGKTKFIRF